MMRFKFIFPLIVLSFQGISIAQKPPLHNEISQEDIIQKRNQYKERINQLENFRQERLKIYKKSSFQQQSKILSQIKTRLETELTEHLFPAWYGTAWDFNGTSNEPGKGKIACGYFVSTNLKHLGFELNRFKLAQQPSQKIISTFMKRSAMDISSQRSLPDIKKKLMQTGDGIYIIGLDTHVGFIAVKGESITFVHSSYYPPGRNVIAEPYDSQNPLKDSKYRVVGKIFHDKMLINWLHQRPYVVTK